MVKITHKKHLQKVPDKEIVPYIESLFAQILETHIDDCPNGSIEPVGAIFFITSKFDLDKHNDFGLSSPLKESRFEWLDDIGNEYIDGLIVVNNSRVISVIGKKEHFVKIMEEW